MRTYDFASSLFWLVLSMVILAESLHLGVGKLHNPGMGFMPFAAAALLGLLAIVLFFQTLAKKKERKSEPLFAGTLWKRIIVVLLSLVAYSYLLPSVGYLISTFVLMTFLLWILEPNRWRWFIWSVFISFLTTGLSYYIFSVLLNCQFPLGLME